MPNPKSRQPLPRLHEVRLRRTLSQRELARVSGVGVATIVRAEAGAPVNELTAVRLAKALEVSVQWLRGKEADSSTESR